MEGHTLKRCSRCRKKKRLSQFTRNAAGKDGRYSRCKSCTVKPRREQKLRARYGISADEYNATLLQQGGVCAICSQPETSKGNDQRTTRNLSVDHCHLTGKNRGLLCGRCNRAIGLFQDRPLLLVEAAAYVLKHRGGE